MEKNNAAAEEGVHPPPGNSSAAASSGGVEEQEESGWTDYLEDYFSYSETDDQRESSSIGSCSWDNNISDGNTDINDTNVILSPFSSVEEVILDVPKKLTFKKTRTQKLFQDDSLEDTATSPIHSPKVADLKLIRTSHVNPRFDDRTTINNSTGSGRQLSGNYFSTNTEKAVYSGADLKEKGLCLFPLSMLLNYHG